MPWYEFLVLFLFIGSFLFGFLICLFRETKSNCDLRKRLISHMDRIEFMYNKFFELSYYSSDHT